MDFVPYQYKILLKITPCNANLRFSLKFVTKPQFGKILPVNTAYQRNLRCSVGRGIWMAAIIGHWHTVGSQPETFDVTNTGLIEKLLNTFLMSELLPFTC